MFICWVRVSVRARRGYNSLLQRLEAASLEAVQQARDESAHTLEMLRSELREVLNQLALARQQLQVRCWW